MFFFLGRFHVQQQIHGTGKFTIHLATKMYMVNVGKDMPYIMDTTAVETQIPPANTEALRFSGLFLA